MQLTIAQILPALESGGVERGTIEIAQAIVRAGHRSLVISAGGGLVPRLAESGTRHIALAAGKKSIFVVLCIKRLAHIIETENINILHARSRLPAWIAWLAIKCLPADKRPVFITTVHGQYSVNQYSRIMLYGDQIIAPSQYIYDYIQTNYPGTDMNKVHTIPRGVSGRDYPYGFRPSRQWVNDWCRQFPQLDNYFVITLPGRLTRLKGHEDFINIIKLLRARNIPAHGLIAGGADKAKRAYLQELKKLVHKNRLENNITFLGKRDDLREIISVSDVIMSLSRSPEAFGRTVLESLSMGIPVVAYKHGGVAEILDVIFPDGAVNFRDLDSCVDKLAEFYRQKPVVKNQNPFTLEAMQNRTVSLYESCVVSGHIPEK